MSTVLYYKSNSFVDSDDNPIQENREPQYTQQVHTMTLTQNVEILLGHRANGTPIASMFTSNQQERLRPTGALNRFWTQESTTWSMSKSGLMLATRRHGSYYSSSRVWARRHQKADLRSTATPTNRLFADIRAYQGQIFEHIGMPPVFEDRVPLLDPEYHDALPIATDDVEVKVHPQFKEAWINLPAPALNPWIDATNAAQVATRAFGKRNYRKPLARLIAVTDPHRLGFYICFANLVPIEHIMEAMAKSNVIGGYLDNGGNDQRNIRKLLEALPAAVISRLLLKDNQHQLLMTLRDAGHMMKRRRITGEQLSDAISTLGQRKIRDAVEIEHLLHEMRGVGALTKAQRSKEAVAKEYDLFSDMVGFNQEMAKLELPAVTWSQWSDPEVRQQLEAEYEAAAVVAAENRARAFDADERKQAKNRQKRLLSENNSQRLQALWAEATTQKLDGQIIGGYRFDVAVVPSQLEKWSSRPYLNNCMDGYGSRLGLDVMAVLVDTDSDKPVFGVQIEKDNGIIQIQGSHQRTVADTIGVAKGRQLLNEFARLGITTRHKAVGVSGLQGRL